MIKYIFKNMPVKRQKLKKKANNLLPGRVKLYIRETKKNCQKSYSNFNKRKRVDIEGNGNYLKK